ncbi:MAG: hypothetical protein EBV58_08045 [Actinobacteria bacterium]|nr:hypothetical protein [Actinomycetota bacterium]
MFNHPQFWWFLSRASGIVAWALLTGSVLWGILLATRVLKAIDRPAWLLDLHRWLSALTIFAVALHLVALYADSYVEFSVTDLMVPFVATWRFVHRNRHSDQSSLCNEFIKNNIKKGS